MKVRTFLNILRGNRKALFVGFTLLFLFIGHPVYSQMSTATSRDEEKPLAFGAGLGYGEFLTRNAWTWGANIDMSWRLKNDLIGMGATLNFDRETKRGTNDPKVMNFTTAVTISYLLSDVFSLGTGLGKQILDDGNSQQKLRFVDGDWGTGAALIIQPKKFPKNSISLICEYNLTDNDLSVTVDLGFVLPF